MNGVDFPVAKVLDGIAAAQEAGLGPIKINMVVRRGINETSVLPMARWAREAGVILRFIEYMDVGHTNGWRLDDVVASRRDRRDDRRRDAARAAAAAATAARSPTAGATATGPARSASSRRSAQPFCGDCTRARLSAEGRLYTCLFAGRWPRPAGGRSASAATDEETSPTSIAAGLARSRRSLLGPSHRGHGRPAAGRDVRDGRLSPAACPPGVHIGRELVDTFGQLRDEVGGQIR